MRKTLMRNRIKLSGHQQFKRIILNLNNNKKKLKRSRKLKQKLSTVNETLGEDFRFFRRMIASFLPSLADPYDPVYLQMDEDGNIL